MRRLDAVMMRVMDGLMSIPSVPGYRADLIDPGEPRECGQGDRDPEVHTAAGAAVRRWCDVGASSRTSRRR